jgi:magnesium chelatase family protein
MAKAAPSILPRLSDHEALEVSRLWSAAGELEDGKAIVYPPYVLVTPNTTQVGLIGGGAGAKAIGAAVRAHRGVLHIDEIQDAHRAVVDSMRGVMEDGTATVVRQGVAAKFPARCWVIATMNPCPCGWHGLYQCRDCGVALPSKGNCTACGGEMESRCKCTESQVRRVQAHVSGPMLDRFDVRLTVPPPTTEGKRGRSSSDLRKAVARARRALAVMLDGRDMREVPGYELAQKFSRVASEIDDAMPRASLRRKHRTLKLGLALAAVDGQGKVGKEHIREAARMSCGD